MLFWKLIRYVIVAYFFVGMGTSFGSGIGLVIGAMETRNAGPVGHGGGYILAGYTMVGGLLGFGVGVLGFIGWLVRQYFDR